MENNLENITFSNPVYFFWGRKVVGTLGATLLLVAPHDDEESEGRKVVEPFDYLYSPWKNVIKALGSTRLLVIGADTFFLHYSLFPKLRRENPDAVLNAVLEAFQRYIKTEEYEKARSVTKLNDFLSLIFARRFTQHFLEELQKRAREPSGGSGTPSPGQAGEGGEAGGQQDDTTSVGQGGQPGGEQSQGQQKEQGDVSGGGQGASVSQTAGSGPEGGSRGQGGLGPLGLTEQDIGAAVQAALEEARKDAETARDLSDAVGAGVGKSASAPLEKLLDLTERILAVSWAREVLALAREISVPHFVHLVKEKERRGDEVAGFRRTLRLEKALPRELALPDDLFYAKLASGGLLSREYYVTREGAYYILIDRSGSMDGVKTLWARSVALALFKLARAKGREFYLRFFDLKVHPPPEKPPLSKPEEVVEYILTASSSGDTSIDNALSVALDDLSSLAGKTNTIIIITDGEDYVSTSPERLRAVGARLVAVMIKGRNSALQQLAAATGGEYLVVSPDPESGGLVVAAAER